MRSLIFLKAILHSKFTPNTLGQVNSLKIILNSFQDCYNMPSHIQDGIPKFS